VVLKSRCFFDATLLLHIPAEFPSKIGAHQDTVFAIELQGGTLYDN